MIVAGIDVDRRYSLDELLEMNRTGRYRDVVLHGYVCRATDDGMIQFVPWHESSLARMEAEQPVKQDFSADVEQMKEDVEREHPITRRTPQQRKDAVARRMANGVPHFNESVVAQVMADSWKKGAPVTGDQIEAVAAILMQRAENENRAADAKRVTRKHMTA